MSLERAPQEEHLAGFEKRLLSAYIAQCRGVKVLPAVISPSFCRGEEEKTHHSKFQTLLIIYRSKINIH